MYGRSKKHLDCCRKSCTSWEVVYPTTYDWFSINSSTTQLRFSQASGKNRIKACLAGTFAGRLMYLIFKVTFEMTHVIILKPGNHLQSSQSSRGVGPRVNHGTMVPVACFRHGPGVSEASEACHGNVQVVTLVALSVAGQQQQMLPKPKRKKFSARNWLAEKLLMAILLKSWPRVGPFCGNDPVNCYQPSLMNSYSQTSRASILPWLPARKFKSGNKSYLCSVGWYNSRW